MASIRPCAAEVDRIFLDANVLFSAAYRKDAGVRKVWGATAAAVLLTSAYAVEEARRNLDTAERRSNLDELLEAVHVSNALVDPAQHPEIGVSGLPDKDLPIMRAAVAAKATHLLTGDRKHFGHLFGEKVAGVLIIRPADHPATSASSIPDEANE